MGTSGPAEHGCGFAGDTSADALSARAAIIPRPSPSTPQPEPLAFV